MARPLRIAFPGAIYRVTARGNARAAIYRSDADRAAFPDLYAAAAARFVWRCPAYCMTANRYPWVVESTSVCTTPPSAGPCGATRPGAAPPA